jgi:hypothetical protein
MICNSSDGNNQTCKVLRNSLLKCRRSLLGTDRMKTTEGDIIAIVKYCTVNKLDGSEIKIKIN